MSLIDFVLRRGRGLRPARSRQLASIDASLKVLAKAASIAVYKAWGIDVSAPEPSRADLSLEVFEPMYPDNMREAVREEIERLRAIEREMETGTPARSRSSEDGEGGDGVRRESQQSSGLRMSMARTGQADEPLTTQEREFLAGIEDLDDGEPT